MSMQKSSYTITNLTVEVKHKKVQIAVKCETLFLLRLRLLLRFLRHTPKPIKEDCARDIEGNIHEQKTKVAPSLAIIRADLRQERIGVRKRAERAIRCCVLVKKISACCRDVVVEVRTARLAGGGIEMEIFDISASDSGICETRGHYATYKVGEGRDAVHKDPEAGELSWMRRMWMGEDRGAHSLKSFAIDFKCSCSWSLAS